MSWTITRGNCRGVLYPTKKNQPWHPDQHTVALIMSIGNVEEIACCGAQGSHIIVKCDDPEQLCNTLRHVEMCVLEILKRKVRNGGH